jgi:NAD(P)H-hydrate epimerase
VIPLLSPAEVREIDRHAVETLGLPSLALMENAGLGATRELLTRFADRLGHVVIFGGPGQNGGDGWVVARHLRNQGVYVTPVLVGARDKVGGDAATNLAVLEAMGVAVRDADGLDLSSLLSDATLVVDGLFGTGLDRPLGDLFAEVVEAVNACAAPVLALDIPSGVHGESGAIMGVAVRADVTATFAAQKRGLHQHPGRGRAGEIVLVSIGVPGPAPDASEVVLLEEGDVRTLVPPRVDDAHKGSAGRVWIFAGSPGKSGAAVLAGLGALRGGAGLVTLAPRAAAFDAVQGKVTELMSVALDADVDGAAREALDAARSFDAAVVGPGLGVDDDGHRFALSLCRDLPRPLVVDADALSALSAEGDQSLGGAPAARVLTPHPGEAARLAGTSSSDVQADRYGTARSLAKATQAIVVLKGAGTIVAAPDGAMRVCPFGTPALATAGTGDVLSGLIAALLGNGLEPFDAAAAGVLIHALAGEEAAPGDRGILASEVAAAIPRIFGRVLTD